MYNYLLARIWSKMVCLVGVHTVMIVTKRALWMTSLKYSEENLLTYSEEGVELVQLVEKSEPCLMTAVLEDFLRSLVEVLARLVGRAITRKLAEEINTSLGGRRDAEVEAQRARNCGLASFTGLNHTEFGRSLAVETTAQSTGATGTGKILLVLPMFRSIVSHPCPK